MNRELRQLEPTSPLWSTFVASHPSATAFHHPAWTGLLAECYGYRSFALVLLDDAGQVAAGVPVLEVGRPFGGRRWISLPFTDYCPLLTSDDLTETFLDCLINEMNSKRLVFELRGDLPTNDKVWVHSDAVRHSLTLSSGPDPVAAQFTTMHRRNIRRGERAGVRIEMGHSVAAVDVFYRLHVLTRKRLGAPVQPYRFFRVLTDLLLERGLGFVLLAHLGETPVAAAIFLTWNGVLIYKYGASDMNFWEFRPNNLLFWAAIKWACENGYHTLDFGRTDLGNQGLRDFKRGWGAREEPLVYSVIGGQEPQAVRGTTARALRALIRYSPSWVCRAIGELFYRYAA